MMIELLWNKTQGPKLHTVLLLIYYYYYHYHYHYRYRHRYRYHYTNYYYHYYYHIHRHHHHHHIYYHYHHHYHCHCYCHFIVIVIVIITITIIIIIIVIIIIIIIIITIVIINVIIHYHHYYHYYLYYHYCCCFAIRTSRIHVNSFTGAHKARGVWKLLRIYCLDQFLSLHHTHQLLKPRILVKVYLLGASVCKTIITSRLWNPSTGPRRFPSQRAVMHNFYVLIAVIQKKAVAQTIELPFIWDVTTPKW